jgi:hypothetical protein
MTQSRDCIDRREFTGRALLAMLAGVTVTISGCGSENGAAPSPPVADKAGVVASNHGHATIITAAQQTAGGSVVLNIQGSSGHDHVLVLTAAEVESIRRGLPVAKDCEMNRSHVHTVSFNTPAVA